MPDFNLSFTLTELKNQGVVGTAKKAGGNGLRLVAEAILRVSSLGESSHNRTMVAKTQ